MIIGPEYSPDGLHPSEIYRRSIIEAMTEGVMIWSVDGRLLDRNAAAKRMLNETLGLALGEAFEGPLPENWVRLDEHGRRMLEAQGPTQRALGSGAAVKDAVVGLQKPDGSRLWFSVSARPILLADGVARGAVTTCRDITEQKRAEQERAAHLHFVESLDRINLSIHGAQDLQQMLGAVLQTVLEVLDCDRAYLISPCDPDTPSWHSPVQRCRPPYEVSLPVDIPVPMQKEVADYWRLLLTTDGLVTYGFGGDLPTVPETLRRVNMHSGIAMALYPNVGKPWAFSLHQCSHSRAWTADDRNLIRQIGGRLTDGLTSMLSRQDLQKRELEFRTLAEHSPDWIMRLDAHGRYLYVNSLTEQFSGLPPSSYIGRRVGEVPAGTGLALDAQGVSRLREGVSNAVRSGSKQSCTMTLTKSATKRIYECRLMPEKSTTGEVVSVLCIARDITELKRNELVQQGLNRSLRLLSKCNQLLIDARDEVTLLGEVCRLIVESGGYCSATVFAANRDEERSISRIASCSMPGGTYLDLTGLSWREDAPGASTPLMFTLRSGTTQVCQDCEVDPRVERWRELLCRIGCRSYAALPLQDIHGLRSALVITSDERGRFVSDELGLLRELVEDLSFGLRTLHTRREHHAAEQQLVFLARHDPLTQLPNRLLLRERFEQMLAQARARHECIAMLFVDLDSFKEINDSLGHEAGDRLLLSVAERLKGCIGPFDIVSREGGDEFLLVLTGGLDRSTVADVANRILKAVEPAFHVGENALHTTLSIGISMFPDDGADFEELRRNSDTALFRAKDSGRNTFHFFDPQMNVEAVERVHLQANLRQALQQGEFRLHYQPQVRASDEQILGVEALIRWQRPDGQMIRPDQFIPTAEKSGLIVPIGEWVLKEACRQAMVWRGSQLPELVMAVNLSVAQFARGNIVASVVAALRESGLPPAALELELTESVLLRDTEGALQTMQALKNVGVRLAIDDFGTGFSSLAYVKRLTVDRLKIAHDFVKEMIQNSQDAAIVRAIIQLAHSLQLGVIAEGVESAAQLALLRSYGCEQIQGYLVGRPMPPEQLSQGLAPQGRPKWALPATAPDRTLSTNPAVPCRSSSDS